MIQLHQFFPAWSLPSGSSFCLKVETYLRMTGLDYKVVSVAVPRKSPTGKLPFITDGNQTIADSRLIIKYLKQTYGDTVDGRLTTQERASAHALSRLIEESLYFAVLYSRWIDENGWAAVRPVFFGALPWPVRAILPGRVRANVRRDLTGQGTARLTPDEIYANARDDLRVLSDSLGEKSYFMGENPVSLDASAYGLLAQILFVPIETQLKADLKSFGNLTAYCERIRNSFFAE